MWVLIWVDFLALGRAAEEKGVMRKRRMEGTRVSQAWTFHGRVEFCS